MAKWRIQEGDDPEQADDEQKARRQAFHDRMKHAWDRKRRLILADDPDFDADAYKEETDRRLEAILRGDSDPPGGFLPVNDPHFGRARPPTAR
jgi:hypothetical protein